MAYDSGSDRIVLYGGEINAPFNNETWAYDFNTNTWTNMNPRNRPPGQTYHAMAYDAQSDRTILFGAGYPPSPGETWAYNLETNSWTNMSPSVGPPPLTGHAMAYDAQSDRVILFGGSSGSGISNETWAYDFEVNSWVKLNPAARPSVRYEHAMAYDAQSDRVILFGGLSYDSPGAYVYLNDTWAFDLETNNWTRMNPVDKPSSRFSHSVIYGSHADRVVLFGGFVIVDSEHYTYWEPNDETWSYDFETSTWTNMSPVLRVPDRTNHGMAYDSESDRAVVFGGRTQHGRRGVGVPAALSDDTWAYNLAANEWVHRNPLPMPFPRSEHGIAYDSQSDRAILFSAKPGHGETWSYDVDTNRLLNKNPASSPSIRSLHSMAYDAQSDRVILFGGETAAGRNDETWAYDSNTNTWMDMNPTTRPSARFGHAMAYDAQSDRVILFGGDTLAGSSDETWVYDFETNTWRNLGPVSGPAGRFGHAMAYDAQSDRIVLSGGFMGSYSHETWAFDFETNTWTNMDPATTFPSLIHHAMAYDAQSDRIVLFGGVAYDRSQGKAYNDETWSYDLEKNRWISTNSALRPSGRYQHGMAYDAQSDRVILFGGLTYDPNTGIAYNDETWAYDFNNDTWTNKSPETGPSARGIQAMAYDAQSDRVILFGGRSDPWFVHNDTWAYDFNLNLWTNLTQIARPDGRFGHAMAYDAQSDRVILFGGVVYDSFSDETWAYDLETNTWTNMNPATRPSARHGHGMAYDAQSDRIVLFAGSGQGHGDNETWTYDFDNNTWTNMYPATAPSARWDPAMTYDSRSDRIVLVGGDGRYPEDVDDVWTYDLDANMWLDTNKWPFVGEEPWALSEHDMVYDSESDRVILFGSWGYRLRETWACDLDPNTWTNMNPAGRPSAVGQHAMAYDAESDRVILFGGHVGIGLGDETWAYDFNTNTWTNMQPSVPSEPRNLRATPGDAQVQLVWEAPDSTGALPITGYRIYGGTASGGESFLVEVGNLLTYMDTGLANGVTYYYQVTAVNAIGEGPPSEEVSTTPATTPLAVRSLSATTGDGEVALVWQAPLTDGGSPIIGYRIYRGTSPGAESFLSEVGNVLTYMDTGLANGVTYYYQVTAVNAIGEGPRIGEVSATPKAVGPPERPFPWVPVTGILAGLLAAAFAALQHMRLAREDVFQRKVRLLMYEFIRDHPGSSFSAVRDALGLKNGVAAYHLAVLEKLGLTHSESRRRHRWYYPNGDVSLWRDLPLSPLQSSLVDAVRRSPGIGIRELARTINRQPSSVIYNVKVLVRENVLRAERRRRKVLCFPTEDRTAV